MIQKRQILYINDNQTDIELTMSAFSRQNLDNRVVVVRNGLEAMEYLLCEGSFKNRKPGKPLVIFMYVNMQGKADHEVLQAVKTNPKLRNIPVVVLGSSGEATEQIKDVGAGVSTDVLEAGNYKIIFNRLTIGCNRSGNS